VAQAVTHRSTAPPPRDQAARSRARGERHFCVEPFREHHHSAFPSQRDFSSAATEKPMIGEHALIRLLSADLPPAPRPQLIDFQNRVVQIA